MALLMLGVGAVLSCHPFCVVIGAVGGVVFDSVLVLAAMASAVLSIGYDTVQHQLKKGYRIRIQY